MSRAAKQLVRQFAAQRRVVPSVPPGRIVRVDEGAADVEVDAPTRRGISGLGLFIDYCDADGNVSHRRIACRSFDAGHNAINAWCFERGAHRQFRIDRITDAACTETGEVLDLSCIMPILQKNKVPCAPESMTKIVMILTFLMRCDGAHPTEARAIENSVTSFALRTYGDDALVAGGLQLASTAAPDGTDFLKAMGWLKRRGDGPMLAKFLRENAATVIDADGRHSAEEVKFGIALGDVLTNIIRRSG